MCRPLALLVLLAACEPQPRIEVRPTTAEARARPFPQLLPVPLIEKAGGPPRLLPPEIVAVERRAEALVGSAPDAPAATGREVARAAALRAEAARTRAESRGAGDAERAASLREEAGAAREGGPAEDLRARAERLRARTECDEPDALPPCPAPDS